VKERYGAGKWKLPGGYVEKDEEMPDAAIREVFEETGVQCRFESLLTIRHSHAGAFGCSDFYSVCVLRPLTRDIVACRTELQDCQWMKISEFLVHQDVNRNNRFFVERYLQAQKQGKFIEKVMVEGIKGPQSVYCVAVGERSGEAEKTGPRNDLNGCGTGSGSQSHGKSS